MDSKNKTLVLLEDEVQVRDFLKNPASDDSVTAIALSPFAMQELNRNKIKYKMPEEYYKGDELYAVGIDNYKNAEKICAIIDTHLQDSSQYLKQNGLRPAFFSFFYLKSFYDALFLRMFQLSRIIDAEKPAKILFYDCPSRPFGFNVEAPGLFFDNRESIYAILLSLPGWKTECVSLGSVIGPEEVGLVDSSVLKLRNFVKHFFKSGMQSKTLNANYTGKTTVLLFGGKYNWGSCTGDFEKSGMIVASLFDDLKYWAKNSPQSQIDYPDSKKIMDKLKSNKELRKLFVFGNINLFPIAEKRFEFLANHMTHACINAYSLSNSFFQRNKTSAILTAGFSTPTSKSVAKAAFDLGVPIISWQHGNYGYLDQPMIPYSDFVKSGKHLVFGEGVFEKYKKQARESETELVSIGSSDFDSLSGSVGGKAHDASNSIIYISTNLYQNHLYVSFPPMWSDNLVWKSQKSILGALGTQRKYPVIVKLHPALEYRVSPMTGFAEQNGFNFNFVRKEASLVNLIPLAEILVIDFPSTTLLQALTTDKPIFTTTAHCKLNKEAEALLKKRVYCFANADDLAKALDSFINTGSVPNYNVDLNNREFVKKYGTYLNDGKSAERAVELVKKLISKK